MSIPPIDRRAPLHQLREQRLSKNRDLKVIITSRNSTTGTGKTTLAVWLALNWDQQWTAEEKGTLSVSEYLDTYQDLSPGSVLVMDEAEQLDARRSMSQDNVDFAEKWMMMRVRNVTSILTLPTASALDKRLKELADVRINVHRRGRARVYKISVDDHDTSQVREWRWHDIEWPDISEHPQMEALDAQKQAKIDGQLEADADDGAQTDPKELRRQVKIETAQRCRDNGDTLAEIADRVGMSEGWVSNNTEKPSEAKP
ncbi:zonular occludens toxin domain-containing protein [Halorubrum ezzemoulense]|uniref:Zonular occludens toxin domain-containing protein n=1 Tax=Halorubrum ezzemoulense TaxID=337243 RepID=A0ABT4Z6B8_HALEZ|nr:zonular occludens toxin domain-containing protein [Halorubrum ezzemoulense]MDB2293723.1 zonular occludens toxin domain-containing protein [Halorubrum ezzemoulense]